MMRRPSPPHLVTASLTNFRHKKISTRRRVSTVSRRVPRGVACQSSKLQLDVTGDTCHSTRLFRRRCGGRCGLRWCLVRRFCGSCSLLSRFRTSIRTWCWCATRRRAAAPHTAPTAAPPGPLLFASDTLPPLHRVLLRSCTASYPPHSCLLRLHSVPPAALCRRYVLPSSAQRIAPLPFTSSSAFAMCASPCFIRCAPGRPPYVSGARLAHACFCRFPLSASSTTLPFGIAGATRYPPRSQHLHTSYAESSARA